MVFNGGMTDQEIISHYGGPTRFANVLGLTAPGSVQRVSNWTVRGIPAEIKLKHPHLFGISIGQIQQPRVNEVEASQAAESMHEGQGS